MKSKIMLVLGLMLTMNAAKASDQPPLKCTIYRGFYGMCDSGDGHTNTYGEACKLSEWDSERNKNDRFSFKYYGKYENDTVYIIWGVNIGASASPDSVNRFEIFGSPRKNGVFNDISIKTDTDAGKPIDLAMYVPISDVSVVCKNY